jgi:hypothetical protein
MQWMHECNTCNASSHSRIYLTPKLRRIWAYRPLAHKALAVWTQSSRCSSEHAALARTRQLTELWRCGNIEHPLLLIASGADTHPPAHIAVAVWEHGAAAAPHSKRRCRTPASSQSCGGVKKTEQPLHLIASGADTPPPAPELWRCGNTEHPLLLIASDADIHPPAHRALAVWEH